MSKPAACTCGHPYTAHASADVDPAMPCLHFHNPASYPRRCDCLRYTRRKGPS